MDHNGKKTSSPFVLSLFYLQDEACLNAVVLSLSHIGDFGDTQMAADSIHRLISGIQIQPVK